MSNFKMDDYVPVNERIDQFYRAHPEGSLQTEIVELTSSRVTVKAYAYRTPDDPRPGVGHSSLDIPGSTPYTRGSEIENTETSAWGRAIAALGFEVKRGIASREEVSNKQPERKRGPVQAAPSPSASAPATYRRGELLELVQAKGLDRAALEVYANLVGIPKGDHASNEQMDALIAAIQGHGTDEVIEPAPAGELSAPEGSPPPSGAPPKPGSAEYKALPDALERAKARGYWDANPEPEQETLAEQLAVAS